MVVVVLTEVAIHLEDIDVEKCIVDSPLGLGADAFSFTNQNV